VPVDPAVAAWAAVPVDPAVAAWAVAVRATAWVVERPFCC